MLAKDNPQSSRNSTGGHTDVTETDFIRNLKRFGPMLMGILNVSPDSFYDGGKYLQLEAAVMHARQMVADGANIIDIGGESTRPGAVPVDVETEWQRVGPVMEELLPWLHTENQRRLGEGKPRIFLSVDTYKVEIARRSLALGADIINDVSGAQSEPEILTVAAKSGANYIAMHNSFILPSAPDQAGEVKEAGRRPTPHTLKSFVHYPADPLPQIAMELYQLYDTARLAGCHNIVLDPGLGFGKDAACNWQLLAQLERLRREFCRVATMELALCPPILIGASNKRFVRQWQEQEEGQNEPDHQRFLSANLTACATALLGGAQLVRSHEVREHYRVLRSVRELQRYNSASAQT